MHDDRHGDDRGFFGDRVAEDKSSGLGSGEAAASMEPGGHDRSGVFAVSYGGSYGGSTASLTGSEGGVVFCGDDARLELFPIDEYGRAVPYRSRARVYDGCFARLGACRERVTVDIAYACVLVVLCVVIVVILLVDQ